jgi:hypothetical protein
MLTDTLGTDPTALLNQLEHVIHGPQKTPPSEWSLPAAAATPNSPFPIPHSEPLHASETPHSEFRTPHSKPGRPPIFDAVKQHTFLRLVSVGFSTRRAARLVGVSPSTVREKARTSPPFACGYEDAKAQAIPALAENVYHAGKRSWRASAWLLERLRPSQFGHRVALGPDPAKRREDERLRQEKKKEQLDMQKPEWNDQILIRCIHRLLTDRRALEIFNDIADDYERQAEQAKAEEAKAAGAEPQSPTTPVEDLDSAPAVETRSVSEEPANRGADIPVCQIDVGSPLQPTDHITPPDQTPADSADPTLETRRVSEDCSRTESPHSELPQTTFCAPAPSARNPDSSTKDPTTETQAPQSQTPIAPSSNAPNTCALTPPAHRAEIPQATCADKTPQAPGRPPPLSDLSARRCATIILG